MAHKACRSIKQGGEIGDPFSIEVLGARASNGRVIVDDELGRVQRSPRNLSIGIPSRKGAFLGGGGGVFREGGFYRVNALWHNVQRALMKIFRVYGHKLYFLLAYFRITQDVRNLDVVKVPVKRVSLQCVFCRKTTSALGHTY
jgi:hypothetical protein